MGKLFLSLSKKKCEFLLILSIKSIKYVFWIFLINISEALHQVKKINIKKWNFGIGVPKQLDTTWQVSKFCLSKNHSTLMDTKVLELTQLSSWIPSWPWVSSHRRSLSLPLLSQELEPWEGLGEGWYHHPHHPQLRQGGQQAFSRLPLKNWIFIWHF